jgi:hypothetical protein
VVGEAEREAASRAVVAEAEPAAAAVAWLRQRGPRGLDAFLAVHAGVLDGPAAPRRVLDALDTVCAQKHCAASRLYWYTDLTAAQAEARATGRPILSLRLLGRLDEELSCANSRFFRQVLYADPAVARVLRSAFVLHWRSVRPVPRVTIDFGDGRVLTRTLTGNSIHYVLDVDGHPVDALPGLYAPGAFLRGLAAALEAARGSAGLSAPERRAFLAAYHRRGLAARDGLAGGSGVRPAVAASPAVAADRRALAKSVAEAPLLRAILPPATRERIVRGASDAGADGRLALARFERALAEDTRRNETELHAAIHAWLAAPAAPDDVEVLNDRVYADLFLTPTGDPWLGLAPLDAYAALAAP